MTGLYALKAWFTRLLAPALKLAVRLKLSPNWLTLLGVAGAGLAAWALGQDASGLQSTAQLMAPIVLLGLVVRLAGANLDGAVARARGLQGSTSGFWINELGDRASDLIVMVAMAGLAPSLLSDGALGVVRIAAVVAANLPTLVSVVGHFRVGTRINGGPVGKTERCALVALAAFALAWGSPASSVLALFYWLIILGSVLTALLRLRQISRLRKAA